MRHSSESRDRNLRQKKINTTDKTLAKTQHNTYSFFSSVLPAFKCEVLYKRVKIKTKLNVKLNNNKKRRKNKSVKIFNIAK